ncbi:MAG: alpha-galactosidase [Candidatus Omnitrophica bacterium]|nr:alpha-galactosidase [Candidatus Omnitrophota bacterium]
MPRPKICFIGAGSLGFTRGLVRDILTFETMRDAHISLMDIDEERLSFSKEAVDRIIELGKYPAKVEATLDRKQALKDADAVLCTILVGDTNVWRHDIEIPKKYGVNFNVGDTRGVAGIFRALRTIPVMLDICRDIERLCPDAILLNYTNPMSMNCKAMQSQTSVKVTGLCHSVQGTAAMLAEWLGLKYQEIDYVCAGINHQAWFLELKKDNKDLYPKLKELVRKDKKIYNKEIVRNEMFLQLGYYVTESSGHNSEYNWWFRKREDLIKKYCTCGTNWNPGEYAFILKHYLKTEKTWKDQVKKWLASKEPISLERGHEYAAYIINAYLGGEPYLFNGNVPNTGLVDNLPGEACVEVPVLANRRGFNPIHVGPLPAQCAALNSINIASELMAVEGCLKGDPEMVFHAVAYDPLSAAVLSLAEIRKMVQELFNKNKKYLPTFKNVKIT